MPSVCETVVIVVLVLIIAWVIDAPRRVPAVLDLQSKAVAAVASGFRGAPMII